MIHPRVIVVKNPEEMGVLAADQFEAMIQTKPAAVIGLATGSTPLPLYRELAKREKEGKIEALNLDFVIRIREYPKNKKGKKKSIVLD